ncbi:MAG: hypothetical protein ACK47B_14070 [Armatimonadota bacterium]
MRRIVRLGIALAVVLGGCVYIANWPVMQDAAVREAALRHLMERQNPSPGAYYLSSHPEDDVDPPRALLARFGGAGATVQEVSACPSADPAWTSGTANAPPWVLLRAGDLQWRGPFVVDLRASACVYDVATTRYLMRLRYRWGRWHVQRAAEYHLVDPGAAPFGPPRQRRFQPGPGR